MKMRLSSVCPKTQVSGSKSSLARLAKPEKAQFTLVNEHFSGKHNAARGLFGQTLSISLFAIFFLYMATSATAQKTVTVEIKTRIYCDHCNQCETCGLKFDKELFKLKGFKNFTVVGNIITVSYNPKKITLNKIREVISNLGYDADDVKATEAGLNNLDGCCRKRE